MKILPLHRLGWWSTGLAILTPIMFIAGSFFVQLYKDVPAGNSIVEDVVARPGIASPMMMGMACGVSAFIVGIIAIIKQKEYSLFTILSTVFGGLLTLFLLGEVLFPH